MKILFVIPSNINSATGRYINVLSNSLNSLGVNVSILCSDGSIGSSSNINYISFNNDDSLLPVELKMKLCKENSELVVLVGCRAFSTAVGAFCYKNFNSRLCIQHEDPDAPVFSNRLINFDVNVFEKWFYDILNSDEYPEIPEEFEKFSKAALEQRSLNPWFEPESYGVCLKAASGHFAISKSMQDFLYKKYNIESVILPPVADCSKFHSLAPFASTHKIRKGKLNFSIGGGIYDYDNSFIVLLRAFSKLDKQLKDKISISIFGRWWRDIEEILNSEDFHCLDINLYKKPDENLYNMLIARSDIFIVPAIDSEFSKLRFPSRIANPMLMNKNVIVHSSIASDPLLPEKNVHTYEGSTVSEVRDSLEGIIKSYFDGTFEDLSFSSRAFAINYFDPKIYSEIICKSFIEVALDYEEKDSIDPVLIDPISKWLDKWIYKNVKFYFTSLDINFYYINDSEMNSNDSLYSIASGTKFPIKKLDAISKKNLSKKDLNILIINNSLPDSIDKSLYESFQGVLTTNSNLLVHPSVKFDKIKVIDSFDDSNILFYHSIVS